MKSKLFVVVAFKVFSTIKAAFRDWDGKRFTLIFTKLKKSFKKEHTNLILPLRRALLVFFDGWFDKITPEKKQQQTEK